MSRYLETAASICAELAASMDHAGRWESYNLVPDGADGHTVVRMMTGAGHYDGSAGIGMVLAAVAGHTGSSDLARSAKLALSAAVADGSAMVKAGQLGLSAGAAGVALAVETGGRGIGEAELVTSGRALAREISKAALGPEIEEVDLIAGQAGTLVALLALDAMESDECLREAIGELASSLASRGKSSWWGHAIPNPPGIALCGLGHGAAGIGWALHDSGTVLGDAAIAAVGEDVIRFEDGWFFADTGSWPDLRSREEDGASELGWMDAWCHGALGIGMVRWDMFAKTGKMQHLAMATAAMGAARRFVVASAAAQPPDVADMTLCHGLCGAAELMLIAHEVTGRIEHLQAARRVGDTILRLYALNNNRWTVGLPGGSDVPGLFLGRAGIAATMLRLHDVTLLGSPAMPGRAAPVRS